MSALPQAVGKSKLGAKSRGTQLASRFSCATFVLLVAICGCASTRPASAPPVRPAEPDPAPAVFAHCRELVCTNVDLPACEFTEIDSSIGQAPQTERFDCRRAADHLECESLRSALGGETLRRLKFNCVGDPLECELLDQSVSWASSTEDSAASLGPSCHRAPRPDAPSTPALPSPDTA